MNGLDLLLIAAVVALAIALSVQLARMADEWEDDLERRWQDREERLRRELDSPPPFDWALELLDEIDRLPEVPVA